MEVEGRGADSRRIGFNQTRGIFLLESVGLVGKMKRERGINERKKERGSRTTQTDKRWCRGSGPEKFSKDEAGAGTPIGREAWARSISTGSTLRLHLHRVLIPYCNQRLNNIELTYYKDAALLSFNHQPVVQHGDSPRRQRRSRGRPLGPSPGTSSSSNRHAVKHDARDPAVRSTTYPLPTYTWI